MSLTTLLLGINEETNSMPAILINNLGQQIPIYTPFVVEDHSNIFKGTLYFPSFKTDKKKFSFNKSSFSIIKNNGIVQDRRVKTITEFEYKKILKIKEFISTKGAVTFIIEEPTAAIDFLTNLFHLKKEFLYTAFYENSTLPSYDPNCTWESGELLTLAVTIYDLSYAIPIFNKKKSQGMAFTVSLILPKDSERRGKLSFIHEMSFAMNSYPDNLLLVDGVKLRDKSFVHHETVDHYVQHMKYEIRRRNELQKYKLQ
jgi:hypothetical protein